MDDVESPAEAQLMKSVRARLPEYEHQDVAILALHMRRKKMFTQMEESQKAWFSILGTLPIMGKIASTRQKPFNASTTCSFKQHPNALFGS
jgi:hypothetical protein